MSSILVPVGRYFQSDLQAGFQSEEEPWESFGLSFCRQKSRPMRCAGSQAVSRPDPRVSATGAPLSPMKRLTLLPSAQTPTCVSGFMHRMILPWANTQPGGRSVQDKPRSGRCWPSRRGDRCGSLTAEAHGVSVSAQETHCHVGTHSHLAAWERTHICQLRLPSSCGRRQGRKEGGG